MTRPSEAEVTEAIQELSYLVGMDAPVAVERQRQLLRILRAALSTPPLPSAEPVHEGDGLTWTEFRNHVARVLADAGQHGLRVAFLRRCFTDTTRPPPRRKPRAD